MSTNEPVKILDKTIVEKVKVIASALIYNAEGKVLAIKLQDTDGKVMYIPPGGRPEKGETLRDCVVREAKEEVNLVIDVTEISGIGEKSYEDGVWTILYYKSEVVTGVAVNNEATEIQEVSWVDIEELDGAGEIRWVR
jgi:8-oxo-dGTP diphosphatase